MSDVRYVSLFSGIGGFELGIERAHQAHSGTVSRQSRGTSVFDRRYCSEPQNPERGEHGPACVGFSEIDKHATRIYRRHFPHHEPLGDITGIDARNLPDFDLLVAGFPCQAFSIAGKRGGFADTRGTLFFEIARIAREKQPPLLLLENVKGLLSHDEGRTFATILTTLDELGYDLQWQVLNSKDFGVPQNRERVFIVGHFRGTPRPEVFPFTAPDQAAPQLHGEISNTLTARYEGATEAGTYVVEGELTAQRQPLRYLNRNQKAYSGDYAFTVDSSQTSGIGVGDQIRRLTPLECERLQGFPDGWTEGISDTQRYKCLGNTVTVNVVEAIAIRLLAKGN